MLKFGVNNGRWKESPQYVLQFAFFVVQHYGNEMKVIEVEEAYMPLDGIEN